jgi:hypothetical protein
MRESIHFTVTLILHVRLIRPVSKGCCSENDIYLYHFSHSMYSSWGKRVLQSDNIDSCMTKCLQVFMKMNCMYVLVPGRSA